MTAPAGERLVSELQDLAANTQEFIRETAEDTSDRVVATREKLRRGIVELQRSIEPIQQAVIARGKAANAYVRDKPWPVVAGVAGVALLVGYILGRR